MTSATPPPPSAPPPSAPPSSAPPPSAPPPAPPSSAPPPLVGVDLIRQRARTLPHAPGVYRFLDSKGAPLYIGKARSLRRRVGSYANIRRAHADRIRRMTRLVCDLEIDAVGSEAEALLLEANLVRRHKPPYNVVLRDDKSFPVIVLTNHAAPRLVKRRATDKDDGKAFGPFASASHVRLAMDALQRAFLLRTCSDAVFANRSRPCLLHQLKRCAAPCTGAITTQAYADLVAQAERFLSGRAHGVQRAIADTMEAAAARHDYEDAAILRDRIRALAHIQARQGVNLPNTSADIIALARDGSRACVYVAMTRAGLGQGGKAFFLRCPQEETDADALAAFCAQFYASRPPPRLALTNPEPAERALLEAALTRIRGKAVEIRRPRRGQARLAMNQAMENANLALARRIAEESATGDMIRRLGALIALPKPPERVEIYDNSHMQGAHAMGAMVVATPEGFATKHYRLFAIRDAAPDDDYAMTREVFARRFAGKHGDIPDLILIDGGQGQRSAAKSALLALGIPAPPMIGVAKGPDRNAGRERLYLPGREAPLELNPDDPLLLFIQRLRDEAHRFAIGAQRRRAGKPRSALDSAQGIGPARRRALLRHFGSTRAIADARLEDIAAVPGISLNRAKAIHAALRTNPVLCL